MSNKFPAGGSQVSQSFPTGSKQTLFRFTLPAALPFVATIIILAMVPPQAKAVPAYVDQTGLTCQACHVGGFGPQLTPMGRQFKIEGYTMRSGASVPISAVGEVSFTRTKKDQDPPPEMGKANNNLLLDRGSLYLTGGIGQNFGGFVEVAYEGAEKAWMLDMLDLRAVTKSQIFGQDAVLGLSLNNSPTVQDPWNTTPAWSFPYTQTTISRTPGAAPLINGGLGGKSIGLTAYAWLGQKFYMEGGAYSSPRAGTLRWLGVESDEPGDIKGLAPYGRAAWQGPLGGGTAHVGAYFLQARIRPHRNRTTSLSDRYTDFGLDASWQKTLGTGDALSAQMRYTRENADLQASCLLGFVGPGGNADCARIRLNEWRGDIGYNWRSKIGVTLGAFSTTGNANSNLYGGPTAKPDSNGLTAQLDYTPWANSNGPLGRRASMRVGLQYTAYGKFDGARSNYDGANADASDNNALRVFTWLAF